MSIWNKPTCKHATVDFELHYDRIKAALPADVDRSKLKHIGFEIETCANDVTNPVTGYPDVYTGRCWVLVGPRKHFKPLPNGDFDYAAIVAAALTA